MRRRGCRQTDEDREAMGKYTLVAVRGPAAQALRSEWVIRSKLQDTSCAWPSREDSTCRQQWDRIIDWTSEASWVAGGLPVHAHSVDATDETAKVK